MQDQLFHDPALVQFYDAENGWREDTRFCVALAADAKSVLDLGCGTGLLPAALGVARDVWGVDPAAAMLEVARRREGGDRVTWVEADARTVRLGRRFDLILLTGHAFQCFLTDADQRALCETIAAHLAPGGRFIFDSRNPAREEWREWVPARSERVFELEPHGRVTAWNDVSYDPLAQIVTYQTSYRTASKMLRTATSRIRFAPKKDIAQRIAEAGLAVDKWLGDWQGGAYKPDAKEIIPIGRSAA
ncbi:class I SAM-dependent methyltransferase [Aestuariivirga sp.]|uniref:class I SAM-dependent methyltransferase n=1 Tax=Aestuariivirga sp. TaxID=2650926 RepID=UPI003BABA97B